MKRKINGILLQSSFLNATSYRNKLQAVLLFLLLFFFGTAAYAQNERTITGTVVDEGQVPIIGASVVVKGNASVGSTTDADGEFSLRVPSGAQALVISYLGMLPQEVSIAGKNSIRVILKEDQVQLGEVVVIGYGQQKKESIVGAITQTTGKVLERAGGVSSVGAALTGNLPGVVTTSSTGMPGEEDPRIVIRGRSSWNNSDPLVLVDGIERPMSSVDIASVETISVLKDASATAVFGVKGANGVILITTKRGKEGQATINIGANTTMKAVSKLPGKYDSYDALRIRNMAIERELAIRPDSWSSIMPQQIIDKYRYPADLEESERYPNIDWADELFSETAMSYNVNANISGGTPFVKYFANIDFLNEGDMYRKIDNGRGYPVGYGFNRLNVRSNLDFELTKTTALKVGLSGSHGVKDSPWGASGDTYSYWQSAYSGAPDLMMPRYSDGTWGYYSLDQVGGTNSKMLLALGGSTQNTTTRINTDFTLEQDLKFILKGLNFRGTVSWDNSYLEIERGINDLYHDAQLKWIDPKTGAITYKYPKDGNSNFDYQEGILWATQGGSVNNNETYRKLYYQLQLNYGATYGKHSVSAMGLLSREEFAKGSELLHYRQDWVFRTTYDYHKKYFLEYNGAYNGSEQFAPEYRMAFFSSGALGWMLSEESFMKGLRFLDSFKIRGSLGGIGDDGGGNFDRWMYMMQWSYGNTAKQGLINGDRSPYTWYRESVIGNPDVHWETVVKTNVGIDYSIFKGLFAGSVDVFQDNRRDVLVAGNRRAVPSYFGASAPAANLGKVKTKGYEIELRFNHVFGNNFRLWANGSMTHAVDRILEADDSQLLPLYQKQEGKHIGQTYSYVGAGYYNNWDEAYATTIHDSNDNQKLPGGYQIIDFNGDGVINTYDNVPYAYPETPQNTYNATLGFEWKGFGAFVQFYGVNNVTRQVVFNSFGGKMNTVYDQGSYWSKYDMTADSPLPRWISTPSYYSADQYMYDASYVRLKNVEVSYTFDSGLIKKIGLKNLRIFLNGNNLWVWSKMPDDRESNFAGTGWASQGAYPTVKRFNLGVNINL